MFNLFECGRYFMTAGTGGCRHEPGFELENASILRNGYGSFHWRFRAF